MTSAVSLVRDGYLPRELPPTFTATSLSKLAGPRSQVLPSPPKKNETLPATHNLARAGGLRRPLRLPNPRGFVPLAQLIEAQWPAITLHLQKSQGLSRSNPIVSGLVDRALVPRVRIGELPKLKAQTWRGSRYILFTDIAQFYSSLYTHSISWALHTKQVAKRNRTTPSLGNRLDKAIRGLDDGQTSGIPIGPDTSLVVAEIVLTAVDAFLAQALGRLSGFRYMDDYVLAWRTLAQAEEALTTLEGLLADFELNLNPAKTGIEELPFPFAAPWASELLTYPVRAGGPQKTINDVVAFFSRAHELAAVYPRDGVIRYALQRSREFQIASRGWRTFQGLVLTSMSADATSAPVALDVLELHSRSVGEKIEKTGVCDALESQILRHAPLRNGSEVAWAIWLAIRLQVNLGADVAAAISTVDDDFVALLALDAASRRRFPRGALDPTLWDGFTQSTDALIKEHWLLTYEGARKGWLPAGAPTVAGDPFFHALDSAGVTFYNRRPRRRPFRGPSAPFPGGALPVVSV